jgi:antibiotic biosynthesis monooxygenase (ABM) superfamily enzyme
VNDAKSPPRYKLALLTWAAAFPLMTALTMLLGWLLNALPLPGRTLLMTGLLIGLLTYVIMPRLTRLCAAWLSSSDVAGGEDEKGTDYAASTTDCSLPTYRSQPWR